MWYFHYVFNYFKITQLELPYELTNRLRAAFPSDGSALNFLVIYLFLLYV